MEIIIFFVHIFMMITISGIDISKDDDVFSAYIHFNTPRYSS